MKITGELCDACGATYKNPQAIGYAGWWHLMAPYPLNREVLAFCSALCLSGWIRKYTEDPEAKNRNPNLDGSADYWQKI